MKSFLQGVKVRTAHMVISANRTGVLGCESHQRFDSNLGLLERVKGAVFSEIGEIFPGFGPKMVYFNINGPLLVVRISRVFPCEVGSI